MHSGKLVATGTMCLWMVFAAVGHSQAPAPKPDARYMLGEPYSLGGLWSYPKEEFGRTETGFAAVLPDRDCNSGNAKMVGLPSDASGNAITRASGTEAATLCAPDCGVAITSLPAPARSAAVAVSTAAPGIWIQVLKSQ